jgi:hypothetical protein
MDTNVLVVVTFKVVGYYASILLGLYLVLPLIILVTDLVCFALLKMLLGLLALTILRLKVVLLDIISMELSVLLAVPSHLPGLNALVQLQQPAQMDSTLTMEIVLTAQQ